MDKKIPIIMIAVLLIMGVAYVMNSNGMLAIFQSSGLDFIKPQWGRLECEPQPTLTSKYTEINKEDITKEGVFIKCGVDEYTNQCTFSLALLDNVWATREVYYHICNFDGTGCGPKAAVALGSKQQCSRVVGELTYYKSDSCPYFSISPVMTGKAIKIIGVSYLDIDIAVKKTFNQWQINRYEGSSKSIAVPSGCKFSATTAKTDTSGIISQKMPADRELNMAGGEGDRWIHYIYDWIPTTGYQIFTHPTYGKTYCDDGKLYSLTKVTLLDGRVKQIDPTTQSPKDNSILQFNSYGSQVGVVECCPYEEGCCQPGDPNAFTRKCFDNTECAMDIECKNKGGFTCSGNKVISQEKCVQNKCVQQTPLVVDCCNDRDCESGKVCDQLKWECVSSQGSAHYCGDRNCNSDETDNPLSDSYCPSDCGKDSGSGDSNMMLYLLIGVIVMGVIISIVLYATRRK